MAALNIRLASHEQEAAGVDDTAQEIEVTHLETRELSVAELQKPFSPTPGIIILLPQSDSFSLVIDARPIRLIPGLARLLSGNTEMSIASASLGEDGGAEGAWLQMIEINALINGATPLHELLNLPTQLDPLASEEFEHLYGTLSDSRKSVIISPGSGDITRHMAAARLVVLMLASAGTGQVLEDKKSWDRNLLKLKHFMMRHLAVNPSIEEMASYLGMSRSKLYRWATPLLGDTPVHYLRKLRLEKCQELLRNTSLSIEQIAEQTGFSSRYHLTREFAKQYKVSPAKVQRDARGKPEENLPSKVDTLIREHCFAEALDVCETTFKHPEMHRCQDRIRNQQAHCLYSLGRIDEALSMWESLRGSSWDYEAGKQLCIHYYRSAEYDRALAIFSDLFADADDNRQRELILIWSHQVGELIARRLAQPLPRYLEVRNDLFPTNLRSMSLTAEALIGLGQDHRVSKLCPNLPIRCYFTMRRAGWYREAIERFGNEVEPHHILETLLKAGQYEEVLNNDSAADFPEIMASALVGLGRSEEAMHRYPDHCQAAYYALGRYRELIDRFPEPTEYQVFALHALKRYETLRNYPKSHSWLWHLAQFLTGPENFIDNLGYSEPQLYYRAMLWKTLRHTAAGEVKQARECLAKIPLVKSRKFWWPDRIGNEILLTTITRGLFGDREQMQAELETIKEKHQYTDLQGVWHDVMFLLGDIDAEQYRSQPCKPLIDERLMLVEAFDKDLQGSLAAAAAVYRAFLDKAGACRNHLHENPELATFIEWRLRTHIPAQMGHPVFKGK